MQEAGHDHDGGGVKELMLIRKSIVQADVPATDLCQLLNKHRMHAKEEDDLEEDDLEGDGSGGDDSEGDDSGGDDSEGDDSEEGSSGKAILRKIHISKKI